MTLILTCLTHDHIVLVADRRLTTLDGTLYDYDTNKAVFFGGRVCVGYTGLSQMEGKDTAEWIGHCMKDSEQTESAMNRVAKRADHYFNKTPFPDKKTCGSSNWMGNAQERAIASTLCLCGLELIRLFGRGHDSRSIPGRFYRDLTPRFSEDLIFPPPSR